MRRAIFLPLTLSPAAREAQRRQRAERVIIDAQIVASAYARARASLEEPADPEAPTPQDILADLAATPPTCRAMMRIAFHLRRTAEPIWVRVWSERRAAAAALESAWWFAPCCPRDGGPHP